jgi:catechol 2,3-dioxygenase
MTETQVSENTRSIHPATRMGPATLAVADLDRSLAFYTQVLGFHVLEKTGSRAVLGAADRPLLVLTEKPGARRQPERSTGLYHIAILLPTRADLARTIQHIAESRYPLQGASDHLVSEAFYLADPDGNGLEIYRDRPREQWTWTGPTIQMASDPIDLDSLFGEIQNKPGGWTGLPAGTQVGHMHLRVGNVREGVDFYHGLIGFDITAQMPGAAFLSAGGYHHHLGMNTWQSQGAPPPPPDSVGLQDFTVVVPDNAELDRIESRLKAAGVAYERQNGDLVVRDPWQTRLTITTES